ncbi:MAG: hypothetical protein K9W44_10890 [Candidatus Lokiarchaeota archaeon]|nr:hypothetical protein [Candidatus Harpocratesius repetitus]
MSKDSVMVVLHIPSLVKVNFELDDFQTIAISLLDKYDGFVFLHQGFEKFPINHLLHRYILQSTVEDYFIWIPTRTASDTALCLRSLAKRLQIEDKPPSMGRVKPKWRNLAEAQMTLLEGLLLTGTKKAKELAGNYASPFALFQAIHQGENVNVKGFVKGFGKVFVKEFGKEFGKEFVKKNRLLFTKKIEKKSNR